MSKVKWKPFESKPTNQPILIYFQKPFDNSNIHVGYFTVLNNGAISAMISGKWLHSLESYVPTHWAELPLPPIEKK